MHTHLYIPWGRGRKSRRDKGRKWGGREIFKKEGFWKKNLSGSSNHRDSSDTYQLLTVYVFSFSSLSRTTFIKTAAGLTRTGRRQLFNPEEAGRAL